MKQAIFVSPHLDDAIFSAGAMIIKLRQLGYECTVLNVFSQAGKLPQTLSAKAFLGQIGQSSAEVLYEMRRKEDALALEEIGAKVIMMDKVEALWRKKKQPSAFSQIFGQMLPELLHIYPTYKFHIASGKIAPEDLASIPRLRAEIQSYCSKGAVVFCPLGIGGHIDHVIVRKACEGLSNPVIYWSDIPYVVRPNRIESDVDTNALQAFSINDPKLLLEKETISKVYKTQYTPVFEELKPSEILETYYYNKDQVKSFDKEMRDL